MWCVVDCDLEMSEMRSPLPALDRSASRKKKMVLHLSERPASWPTNQEVPGSIPGSTVGIFPEGEDCRGEHGLGRLVEFRFKGPPGTTCSYITTHIIGTT